MHSKFHIVTTTILGTLVAAGTAFAQTADSDRYVQQRPAATAPTPRSGPTCPAGCVPVRSPEVQARLERERAARRVQRRAKEAEYAREQATAQQQTDAQRAEDERLAQIKIESIRAEREQAERDRIAERERLAQMRVPSTTTTTTIRAVGGGPSDTHHMRLNLSADTGVGGFTHGMVNSSYVGPTLGMRAGLSITPWFEIEGRMSAMINHGYATNIGDGNHLLTTGTAAVARLNIPMRVVTPYVFTGFGSYRTAVVHPEDSASPTPIQSHATGAIPMGTGMMVPITRHWQIGAEGSYNYVLDGQGYSTDSRYDTHGFWTANSVLRVTM